MSKNFPILEAAASHIEINGQMHELPVYLKHQNAPDYIKICSKKDVIMVSTHEFDTKVSRFAMINYFKEVFTEPCTKQEFDRAFQDAFFRLAQISEGTL